ncbi:MAG: hypothetical protein J6N52_01675 [Clostridia bacterium]|nr:hypothetical protein [Clostridia bacterium]
MKKIQSFILALAMVMSLAVSAMPAGVSAAGITLDSGYEFIDTAYNPGGGVYLAAAKSFSQGTGTQLQIYRSEDGISWKKVKTFSDPAKNYTSEKTRQILVWWEDAGVFATVAGTALYVSPDGIEWTRKNGLERSNAEIETDGRVLFVSGGRAAKVIRPDQIDTTAQHYLFDAQDVYSHAVGIFPGEGRKFIAINTWTKWIFDGEGDGSGSFANIKKTYYDHKNTPYEMVYEPVSDVMLTVNGTAGIRSINREGAVSSSSPEDGMLVTAAGAGRGIIIAGGSLGELCFADASKGLNADTVWTAASAVGNAMSDEVRSITETQSGELLVATASKLYLAEMSGGKLSYTDVNESKKLSKPVVLTSGNYFEGTNLLGGAYSPELNKYVVYGNTTGDEIKGRVYLSEDGLKWKKVLDSKVKFNEGSRNAAVWWSKAVTVTENENQVKKGAFVISTSYKDDTGSMDGTGWFSTNGESWTYSEKPSVFGRNGDIVVSGDYLYSMYSDSQREFHKISNLSAKEADYERVVYSDTNKVYFLQLAVSDDQKYMLMSAGYGQAIIYDADNYTTKAAPAGGSATAAGLVDVKWNSQTNQFVGVRSDKTHALLINTDGTGASTPNVSGAYFTSFDDNGSRYVFGTKNGSIYVTDSKTLGSSTVFTEVVPAGGEAKNTYEVKDVFAGANGQVIVTVSDGFGNSDVLIVNSNGSEYVKVSDGTPAAAEELIPGANVKVQMSYKNNGSTSIDFVMITAVYDSEGRLIQVNPTDETVSANTVGTIKQEMQLADNVDSTCKMKIMMFNDMQSLVPLCAATGFFQ